MNILLINHYAGSDKYGMEYRPFYLAREWVKLGHKVSIVAASFSHLRNQNPNINGNVTEEIIEGIRYVWLKTPGYQGNGIARVINIFSFIKRLYSADKEIMGFVPDIVIASSTYPFDIYPARYFQKKYGCKCIFEVHDLWPSTLIELGGMNKRHPFIVCTQKAENYAYRKADKVVSLLPKASEYMQNHGMSHEKFIYIPNGISKEEWENNNIPVPEQYGETFASLKNEGRFIIGYTGSHGMTDTLYTLIEAAVLLKNEPVTFVLVGKGPEKEKIQKKVNNSNLKNVLLLPPVPKSSISKLLDMMDALYIGCERNPIYRFGISPNKLFDYMMAGKPVIQAIEAGNDIVAENGCGMSIPPENPNVIAEAVIKLVSMTPDKRIKMGLRGKEYVLARHDYKVLAKDFLNSLA